MKRFLFLSLAMAFFCTAGISQKIKITSQKAENHILSIMSYNIRHGSGMDRKVDLSRIAHEISLVGPDVVALQEVDKNTTRVGGVDSPSEIARLAGGYVATFASAMDFGGGQYGNAILSKKAPLATAAMALPGAEEPRVMLIAEFDDFYFCSLHMSLDSASRVEACRMVAQVAQDVTRGKFKSDSSEPFSGKDKPFYIAGDFNLVPNSVEMRVLAYNFGVISSYQIHTFPSDNPNRTLDYIAVYNRGAGKKLLKNLETGKTGVASWVQPEGMASDHRPIFTVLFKGTDFNTERIGE